MGGGLTLHLAVPSSYSVTAPTTESPGYSTITALGPALTDGIRAHLYVSWSLHPGISPTAVTTRLADSESETALSRTVTSPSVSGATATHEIDASYHGDDGDARAVDFAARTSSGALVVVELVGLVRDPHFTPAPILGSVSISHS